MRVLYVIPCPHDRGGAPRSLNEMLLRLAGHGVDPLVVYWRPPLPAVAQRLAAAGVGLRPVPVPYPTRLYRLRRLIRDEQVDLVHTSIRKADVVGRLAAWGTGTPVVSSFVNPLDAHVEPDEGTRRTRTRLFLAIDRFTARHMTTRFHAVADAVRDSAVAELGVPPERIEVVVRARDGSALGEPGPGRRAAVRARLGISPSTPVVLNVGRLEPQKGQLDLLEAFSQVAAARPDARLLVAGRKGTSTTTLESRCHELGLEERVQLLGHRDDVPDLLAAADVFAFPSRYEGAAGALIEAMALALPIVANRLDSLVETAGDAAQYVDTSDHDAFAAAIRALLDDPGRAAELGARSLARYHSRLTPDACDEQMLELYEHARADRPRRLHPAARR